MSCHPFSFAFLRKFSLAAAASGRFSKIVSATPRTAAGAEIDLVLDVPGHGLWAIEIKRGLTGRPEMGFYSACDLKPKPPFCGERQ
jgi:hypothetical protein